MDKSHNILGSWLLAILLLSISLWACRSNQGLQQTKFLKGIWETSDYMSHEGKRVINHGWEFRDNNICIVPTVVDTTAYSAEYKIRYNNDSASSLFIIGSGHPLAGEYSVIFPTTLKPKIGDTMTLKSEFFEFHISRVNTIQSNW